MGEMNIAPDSLAHVYLNMAAGDWLDIDAANYEAKTFFEPDDERRKALVLSTARVLAEAGYIRIGTIDWEKGRLAEWPGTLDDQIERLSQVYMPEGRDDRDWGWSCVFDLTEEGERVEALLPKLSERFDEDDW